MGIHEKLLKLMITVSWFGRFCELVFEGEGVFGTVGFETVLEVINNVNQGIVLVGLDDFYIMV
jgi:hypothetical protein